MPRRLSLEAARRVAVAAQGLAQPHPAHAGRAALRKTISRIGVLQLDSVNVFERSHYLPLFSRLGPYQRRDLDQLLHHDLGQGLGAYTEYLAHEAAILPVRDWALWQWHRELPERPQFAAWAGKHAGLIDEVREEFAQRGAMRVRQLEHPENVSRGGGWWNRNDVHWAATWLFRRGELVVVGRQRFERRMAVAESVLPPEAHEAPSRDAAIRQLIARAARAHGIATIDDLADYPRLKKADARAAVASLVADGELEPVSVDGWSIPAYLAAGIRVPRQASGAALLSPFDPLVWHRPRAERLFGFHYRISIYTPASQRVHGYYVLPVLVDGELVGRLDLKSDRGAGVLRVQHAHIEPEHAGEQARLATRVAGLLHEAAAWQGLSEVSITGPGTWAAALSSRV